MHILVINFIFQLVLGLFCLYPKPTKIKVKFFVLVSCALLIYLRTFVDIYSVPDLQPYSWGYEQMHNVSLLKIPTANIDSVKIVELGFRYLMKICSLLSPSFTFFLFMYSLLWIGGYLDVIKKYSPNVILSLLLLIVGPFDQSIFVIRQHLAMVVVFLSYKYIIEKKFLMYLFLIVLAFSLHQTALIALPIYFLYHVRGKRKTFFLIIAIAIFLYFSFSTLLRNVGNEMLQGYSSYIDSDVKTNTTGAILMALELAIYVIALKKKVLDAGINRILFLSLSLGLILSVSGIGFNPTSRLVMYYTSVSFLTIPIIASNIKNRLSRNIVTIAFILLYAYVAYYGSGFSSLVNFKLSI